VDLNLTFATDASAILRVDSSTPKASAGRNSVRIESKSTYDTGLFIFDILHTPYGCATWPALWLTDGYNWPVNGEIDVVEANNKGTEGNEVTLHTTAGCSMDVKRKETGSPRYTTCGNETHSNSGCGVQGDPATYGPAFNDLGGGVSIPSLRSTMALTRLYRSMRLSSVTLEFVPGFGRETLFLPISQTLPESLIQPSGVPP
jgi:hypothetical protein